MVSESMLQQTQVPRVVPRFHRFLERFPTPRSCAEAGVGAVIVEWAGLGYNRRAVHLHRCAEMIVAEHGGEVPEDLRALLALPGIGPYTARAVLTFAFDHDVAVVDTNVGRILARTAGRSLSAADAQRRADRLVPPGAGRDWNQAMLDLGSEICRAREPLCPICPVRTECRWGAEGAIPPDPARGSAGVSRPQAPFEGSFRQGRARLLDALRVGVALAPAQWRKACGWEHRPTGDEDAMRAADALVRDGLAEFDDDGSLRLRIGEHHPR